MRLSFGALLLAVALSLPAAAPGRAQSLNPPIEQRSFPVFFTPWSAMLDDAALQGLGEAADLAKAHPEVPILVVGFADPEGSREANILISRLRAMLVAEELVERGVAAARIRTEWRGPTTPAFDSLESRRVEVRVDPTRR